MTNEQMTNDQKAAQHSECHSPFCGSNDIDELAALRQRVAELQALETERKRAEEALALKVKQLTALSRASQAVTTSLDPNQVLAEIVSLASQVVDSDHTSVVLVDEAGRMGQSAENLPGVPSIEYRIRDEGLTSWIVHSCRPVIIDEIGEDGAIVPNLGEGAVRFANPLIVEAGIKSVAGLPLMVKGNLLGVIYLHSLRSAAFHAQLSLLTTFANQAAIAVENARLYEAVQQELGERKRAEQALAQQAEQLRALAARLSEAEETERQRLARELHDQVGQNLTALGINLNIIRAQMPKQAADLMHPRLDDSLALVEETTQCVRDVMADLRPPVLDDYGLMAALRWHGERFAPRTGITVTVQGEEPVPRLDAHIESTLFRIAQEALTNAAKHAQATQATVVVEADGETVRLVITDDGVGFDPARAPQTGEHRKWGLLTMAERAEAMGGRCNVKSHPGRGTQVVVEVAITNASINTAKKRAKSGKS